MAADMASRSASISEASPQTTEASGAKSARARPASAKPASAEDPRDRVFVGLVTRPHGIRGDVKVEVWSDVSNRFDPGHELLLVAANRSARRVRIASSRPIRAGAIVRFDGNQTREQAEALRGSRLAIPRSEVPAAPDGLYYHFDLVGCWCIDADHGELGEVTAVVEDGGGILLEVTRAGQILPVPFVETFLESVDIAGKQIRFRLPPGLVEACEFKS